MKKYEYKRLHITSNTHDIIADLNEHGAQGWENYAIFNGLYFLKRELQEVEVVAQIVEPTIEKTTEPEVKTRKYNKR